MRYTVSDTLSLMQTLFGLFYTVLFLCYIFAALFVVFHILRYSLDRKKAFLGVTFFLSVATILLFINALLFFSLPFTELGIPTSF
jgi:hypothetical protein